MVMISIDAALALIFSNLPPRQAETAHYKASLGCVLAEDLSANCDIPSFDRSAMDGYALRASDVQGAPVQLSLAGEIRAGGGDPGSLAPGEAKVIMTGAPLPEGADAVQIVEVTERSADGLRITINKPAKPGENIRHIGTEARKGATILEAGRLIGPAETAVMATFGHTAVRVWRKPSVAILATGDELVEVDSSPGPDQIRNTNSQSLAAQLENMRMASDYLGIARDDKEDLRRLVSEGMERDVLLLTGGVSVGEYDLAKEVFRELGIEIIFARVAVKPGKPTVFARKGNTLIFGLPGNPVSTFVTFELFVRPALGRLSGLEKPELERVEGELLCDMRRAPGRTAFLPARAFREGRHWKIDPLPWRGSGDIIGFSRGNATLIFPGDRDFLASGEQVEAMLLPDYLGRRR